MFRLYRRRQGLVVLVVAFSLITSAVTGSILLGKLYINILSKGQIKAPEQTSKVVNTNDVIRLEPLPVFLIQTGVFNDQKGAREGVSQIENLGYQAYQSKVKPYRIYVGVFGTREAATDYKKNLEGKSISSYIYPEVLNNSQLTLPEVKNIKNPGETMSQIGQWMQINLALYNGYAGAKADHFSNELAKANQLFNKFSKTLGAKEKKEDWFKNVEYYQKQVSTLQKEWGEENYLKANVAFSGVVSEYINWSLQYTEKQ